jgi:hypothetical protein
MRGTIAAENIGYAFILQLLWEMGPAIRDFR